MEPRSDDVDVKKQNNFYNSQQCGNRRSGRRRWGSIIADGNIVLNGRPTAVIEDV